MSKQPRTQFQFTTKTTRAIAMAEVAGREAYAGDISVVSEPIIGREDAMEAFKGAIKIRGDKRVPSEMTPEDVERVKQRYLKLGREGTSSLVTVYIPDGLENFDHEVFYASVNEVQAANNGNGQVINGHAA